LFHADLEGNTDVKAWLGAEVNDHEPSSGFTALPLAVSRST